MFNRCNPANGEFRVKPFGLTAIFVYFGVAIRSFSEAKLRSWRLELRKMVISDGRE